MAYALCHGYKFHIDAWSQGKFFTLTSFLLNVYKDFLEQGKKRVKNPFIPIGALVIAGVLTTGLISFRQGNS